jgi:glycosyltransferase involved in cell wall biosynthesis
MRVAFDVGPLAGHRTGIGLAVAALRGALIDQQQVQLVDYLVSFRARHSSGIKLPLPAAVAHRAWARSDHPRLQRWLGDVELIHGTNYVVPPSRLPRLVSVYDCWFLRHPEQAPAAVRRAGRVLRRALAGGAHAHVCSAATQQALEDLVPGAITHLVPLGALPMAEPSTQPPLPDLVGRPFVVSIGTIERRKNLPRLVAAFAAVAAAHPDVQLVLAGGDGDDRPAVDAAIDRLGSAADRVVLTGRVDDAALSWLTHHAAVVAYVSLDEGFGFPLLQAMQAEVPIVASTAGSIPEVAGEAAVMVPCDDIEAISSALLDVLGDDALRDRLVSAGRSRWTQYRWDDTAEAITAVYRSMTGSST